MPLALRMSGTTTNEENLRSEMEEMQSYAQVDREHELLLISLTSQIISSERRIGVQKEALRTSCVLRSAKHLRANLRFRTRS